MMFRQTQLWERPSLASGSLPVREGNKTWSLSLNSLLIFWLIFTVWHFKTQQCYHFTNILPVALPWAQCGYFVLHVFCVVTLIYPVLYVVLCSTHFLCGSFVYRYFKPNWLSISPPEFSNTEFPYTQFQRPWNSCYHSSQDYRQCLLTPSGCTKTQHVHQPCPPC